MSALDMLFREGAVEVLCHVSLGEARFKELNRVVVNTKTLSRRLKELQSFGLIQQAGKRYRITDEGFDTVFRMAEFKRKVRFKEICGMELNILRYRWMRVSLLRLVELFLEEFGDELVSFILYGSAAKDTFKLGKSDMDLLYVLEDDATNVWEREEKVFKLFRLSWEYRASDYMLKTRGFYGYPELTMASLHKRDAKVFQPIYLDMLLYRAILYDKNSFFRRLMDRLQDALKTLGTLRIERADGTYYWLLKPNMNSGELIEIGLG